MAAQVLAKLGPGDAGSEVSVAGAGSGTVTSDAVRQAIAHSTGRWKLGQTSALEALGVAFERACSLEAGCSAADKPLAAFLRDRRARAWRLSLLVL